MVNQIEDLPHRLLDCWRRLLVVEFVALKEEPGMETFPGGEFLIVRSKKPEWVKDDQGRNNPVWNIADPGAILVARMGISRERGSHIFQYEGKLYKRAYRHTVRGVKLNKCTLYYNDHPQMWGGRRWALDRVAFVPFKGDYIRLSPQ